MEIKHLSFDKSSIIVIEDLYDEKEIELIWDEVIFLKGKLIKDPFTTITAVDSKGNSLKENEGLWLDNIYTDRKISSYLSLYKKGIDVLKDAEDNGNQLTKKDINLRSFFNTQQDHTLLNYYDDGGYYLKHSDAVAYTYCFYLFREPKRFDGGNLKFDDLDYTVELKSNMSVLFPGFLMHEAEKVKINKSLVDEDEINGRFCFTTFFEY